MQASSMPAAPVKAIEAVKLIMQLALYYAAQLQKAMPVIIP